MLQGITKENVMYKEFIKAIEAEGLTPPAEIIADGKMHRFDSDNSGKKNGAYVYHADEPQSGWFKCWKTGTEKTWCRGYTETDPVKKEQYQKHLEQRSQDQKEKILQLHKQGAIKAAIEYHDAKPADPAHLYLKAKQIKPIEGLKQDPNSGDLIVPIYCKDGNIISLQTINEDGGKYFLKDGQVKGGFFDLGESIENIVICEGLATGISIFEATGYRVRCAFNCGNLKEVAINSREKYPKAHIIIAGDDDNKTEGNPGRTKAIEAASSIDTLVVFPDFGESRPAKATDFNDLSSLKGAEAVRHRFEYVPKSLNNEKYYESDTIQKNLINSSGLNIVKASQVIIRPTKWLWPGVLAIGKMVVIAGDPGLGKSQISLFISAIVSNGGKWPVSEESCEKGSVLILSAEDGAEDTIVPRLIAVNADLEKIQIIKAVKVKNDKERTFDLTKDVDNIRRAVKLLENVSLIIVDPISAYMGETDSHRNSDVRAALIPAIELADEIGACLLCITHLNKSGKGNALSRVTGSIAFTAAARASFLVTGDNSDPDRRLMLTLKNNLAKDNNGFAYRVDEKIVDKITTSRVIWENEYVKVSADEAVYMQAHGGGNNVIAEEFLQNSLADGGEISSTELYEEAKEIGISKKVLWTAKVKIGVNVRKLGYKGGWVWYLPKEFV
jgi:putative DNA primase/helicase